MIKKFLLIYFAISSSIITAVFAQPTLQSINLPVVGDLWSNKTITDTTIQPGPGGMGQIWNFGNYFVNPQVISESFSAPTGAGFDTLFPSANLKVTSLFGGTDYFYKLSNELQYKGTKSNTNEIIISNTQKLLTTPFSYGDSVSNPPVAGTGLFGYLLTGSISVKADGAGDLTLYTGSFSNTLRVVTTMNLVMGAGTGNDTYINVSRYTWYSVLYRAPVFQISILDVSGNLGSTHQKIITVGTLTTSINTPVLNEVNFTVNPNPAHSKTTVSFNLTHTSDVLLKVMDLTGKTWKNEQLELSAGVNNVSVDLATLPKGIYILSAIYGNESRKQRLIVN